MHCDGCQIVRDGARQWGGSGDHADGNLNQCDPSPPDHHHQHQRWLQDVPDPKGEGDKIPGRQTKRIPGIGLPALYRPTGERRRGFPGFHEGCRLGSHYLPEIYLFNHNYLFSGPN